MHKIIEQSMARQSRMVFPKDLNANGTLFGGEAMKWMDEIAFIVATRFTRQRMFTMSTDNVKFLRPILPEHLAEAIGYVEKATPVKLFIKVEIFAEARYEEKREKAIEASFVFVAMNENLSPCRIRYPFDFEQFQKEIAEEQNKE